jgi:hypothetical protein
MVWNEYVAIVFNFDLEQVQENEQKLKFNGWFKFPAILMMLICCVKTCFTERNTGALLGVNMEVDLEVTSEKIRYMFLSRHQTTREIHYIEVANESVVKVQG